MRTSDLENFRRAIQLRDRCNAATIAASHRLEVPMSQVQANVAFDAMVDLIRDHDLVPGLDDLATIDVMPAPLGLSLECTNCGWTEYQDPGGPTLSTLIGHARKHTAQCRSNRATTATRPYQEKPAGGEDRG